MENDRKGRIRHNDCIAAGYSTPHARTMGLLPLQVHTVMPSFPFPFLPHFFLSSVFRSYDDRERPKSIFFSVKNCICVAVSGKSVAPSPRLPCMSLCGVASSALSAACLPRRPQLRPSAEQSDVNPKSVQPFPIDNGLPGTQAALPIDCETPTARDGTSGREVNSYVPIPPLATCSLSNSYVSQRRRHLLEQCSTSRTFLHVSIHFGGIAISSVTSD